MGKRQIHLILLLDAEKIHLHINIIFVYNNSRGCRADRAPFKLLGLDTLLPLDDILNTSQVK